ncbi:MAG: AraC family transcriptional regulator [Pirellulales bacterium]|nr:AraC family transcriptional regulator [Pirellulales bacterium]
MPKGNESFFRYLSVSPRTSTWGLYITGAGSSRVSPQGDLAAGVHPEMYSFTWDNGRTLPEYQIIYITRGGGEFESEPAGRCMLSAGDVVFLFPDVWHRYRPIPNRGWDTYWIGMSGEFLHHLQARGFISPEEPILHAGVDDTLLHPFLTVLDRIRVPQIDNPLLLSVSVMEILSRVFAPAETEPSEPDQGSLADVRAFEDRIVAQAIRFIWNHSHRPMTVEDVVSAVPLTRRTLERRFNDVLGRTIHDEIVYCRIERIKRMLEETSLPMKRIASATGFSSSQHMSKVFHRLEGSAPAEYRRLHRAQGERESAAGGDNLDDNPVDSQG